MRTVGTMAGRPAVEVEAGAPHEFRHVDARRALLAAFEAVGTSRPVELTSKQMDELVDVIDQWSNRVGDAELPEGILDLRVALVHLHYGPRVCDSVCAWAP